MIANQGVAAFYKGEIALSIDAQLRKLDSFLSIEDLHDDVAEWWEPVEINYKGYDIYTIGAPSNGFVSLLILGIMSHFTPNNKEHNSQNYLHFLLEAVKASNRIRLSTPGTPEAKDFITNQLLTDDNFFSIAKSINKEKASTLQGVEEGKDTTHFVIIDQKGNIVSSTQTLGNGFGSKIMIEGRGIWMNNAMAFSTFEPKDNPMDVHAGKYKLSSNSPIIILKNSTPWAALGTPGGHTIPQNISQVVMNLIDFKMGMQDAIDASKVTFLEEENVVKLESGIKKSVISSLKEKGHTITYGDIGNAMGVKIFTNTNSISFDVGVDKRRDGWSQVNIPQKIWESTSAID
ncbi:MAG: hypothetical protein COT84_02670 [Chlamydiae bacterium CG10_big_fil_rev_8_21_14_0_10_35_9]|nr:MAG: hypothetical protein COT84_02670 [Chlamydiae bacterium CG10_big_fil_rev_8_21_14_0_10_35_9]